MVTSGEPHSANRSFAPRKARSSSSSSSCSIFREFRLRLRERGQGRGGLGHQTASLMIELLVAMALLTGALLPVAYSLTSEKRYARACYQRAVAMEIVDGEMETLLAGEWRAFKSGTNEYKVNAAAAANLPPGRFLLIAQG